MGVSSGGSEAGVTDKGGIRSLALQEIKTPAFALSEVEPPEGFQESSDRT